MLACTAMFPPDPMCIPRCAPECQRVLTAKDMQENWALCNKCYSQLENTEQHELPEIFKTDSSCIYPGCFGVPKKDARMCTGTALHDRLARIHRWSSKDIDKLIELRVCFDKFRSTADFSEVHEAMQEQYESAIHKLETGTSLKPGQVESEESGSETLEQQRLEVVKWTLSGSPPRKKQRKDKEFKVMKPLEVFSRPQLLKIHKKGCRLPREEILEVCRLKRCRVVR